MDKRRREDSFNKHGNRDDEIDNRPAPIDRVNIRFSSRVHARPIQHRGF